MSAVRPKPELATHSEVNRMGFPNVAATLKDVLGARVVAYLGEVSETRAVREWADGARKPSEGIQQRLRLALTVALMIAERDDKHVAQAWFQGLNPQLDDVSPARLLRDGVYDDAGKRVLAAARAFMVRG